MSTVVWICFEHVAQLLQSQLGGGRNFKGCMWEVVKSLDFSEGEANEVFAGPRLTAVCESG